MTEKKTLKIPFSYEERQPYIGEQFIYIPWDTDLTGYQFPEVSSLFCNENPLIIEYCSGNGSWIIEQAIANPNKNFFAIEKKFDRVRKIWKKVQKLRITNLIPIYTEGLIFTKTCLKENSTETVYINFPDPWPKRRHRKNRIMNGPFIDELFRILKPQGKLVFVTDDRDYSESFIADMNKKTSFTTPLSAPYYTMPPEGYGMSYFRELFEKQGKNTRYHLYEKG